MQKYQKLWTLAAVGVTAALFGCASDKPAPTAVVVVPTTQASAATQATSPIRSGTVVAVRETNPTTGSSSQGSSGSSASSGASSSEQILTVQFEDGQRQFFQVAAGGLQFQVGDHVTVNTTQGTALITR